MTPQLAVSGAVQFGQPWTLEVTAPGGIGLGYLLVGFSNTSASLLGGVALPLDLGVLFSDPLWSGCQLAIDPSYLVLPYTFDPNSNGGTWSKNFPGFDVGFLFAQAINVDPDFVSRVAGVSRGLIVGPESTAFAGSYVPELVLIPAGSFVMGSNASSDEPYYSSSIERPTHPVLISQPFWMGRTEVTQAEFELVMGYNPSILVGADHPVQGVSWWDATLYCQTLTFWESYLGGIPEGYEYRLPTEAEWEYACRAGSLAEFNFGDELLCGQARFRKSLHSGEDCAGATETAVVASYPPNAWGLYDMHGNVAEWCSDFYAPYTAGAKMDPFVSTGDPSIPFGLQRVVRGGSFGAESANCRSATRLASHEHSGVLNFGFRVVLAPVLEP